MKINRSSIAVLAAILVVSGAASAATVSVTYNANRTLDPSAATGAESVVANWNNLSVVASPNFTSGALMDNSGDATSMTVTSAGWGGYVSMSNDGSDFIKLYEAGLMIQGDVTAGNASLVITGITFQVYDVYIYYTHFPIGSDTLQTWTAQAGLLPSQTLYGTNNKGHGHDWGDFQQYQTSDRATAVTQATTTGADGGGNWLKFTGVSGSTLTLTSTDTNFPDIEGFKQRGIAGFQIVESTIIPEPSTVLAFGLGAGIFALRRRRA